MGESFRKVILKDAHLHTDPVGSSLRWNICFAAEYHILFLNNPFLSWLITADIIPPGWIVKEKSLNKSQLIAFLKKSNFLNISSENRTEIKSKDKLSPFCFLLRPPKTQILICDFSARAGTHSIFFQYFKKEVKFYSLQFTAHKLPLIVLPCKLDTLWGSIKLFITKHLRFCSDNLHIIRQKPTLVSSSMASPWTDNS